MATQDPIPSLNPLSGPLSLLEGLTKMRASNTIQPYGYEKDLEGNPSAGRSAMRALGSMASGEPMRENFGQAPDRQDAWNMYLGLPQENQTFRQTETPSADELRGSQYFSEGDTSDTFYEYQNPENIQNIRSQAEEFISSDDSTTLVQDKMNRMKFQEGKNERIGNLGHYRLRKGKDEEGPYVAYEDKWDIAVNPLEGTFGEPFNVRGKIRYDPETSEIQEKADGGFIHKQDNQNTNMTTLGGPQPQTLPALPEQQLFLGGAVDWMQDNAGALGTAVGAGAGALVGNPMLGAKVGGTLGGAIQSNHEQNERDEMMRNRQRMRNRRRTSFIPSSASATSGSYGEFATGGYIENKLRDGGMVNIGQDAKEIQGPRHEKGGVQLDSNTEVEGGETMDNVNGSDYVFSDRLRVPDSILPSDMRGMTFSEYHKHLVQNNASESEVQELAAIQERIAGRDNASNSPRNIGSNKEQDTETQKSTHMGPLGKRLQQMNQQAAHGGKTKKIKEHGGEVEYQNGGEIGTDVFGIPGSVSTDEMTEDEGFLSQAGDVVEGALPYLPAIMNVGRAAFEDTDVPDVPYTPPSRRAERTTRQMETDVNVEPQIAEANQAFRSVTADPEASMNEKLAAASQSAQQKAQIRSQAENQETSLQNQMIQRLSGLQAQRDQAISQGRTQAAQAERRQQMKADEAQTNLLQTGLQQASRTYQTQQRQQDLREMDMMKFRAMTAGMKDVLTQDVVNDMLEVVGRDSEKGQYLQRLINNQ